MDFNDKKLKRINKIFFYVISLTLCGFLIGLSIKVMSDIEEWEEGPMVEDFYDQQALDIINKQIDSLELVVEGEEKKLGTINLSIQRINNQYKEEEVSFRNWLKTRKTLGSPKEDTAVLNRVKFLDEIQHSKKPWYEKKIAKENHIALLRDSIAETNNALIVEENKAYEKYDEANKKHNNKIFLIRLLIVLPLLIFAIIAIVKFRKSKYWPLLFGYVLFSFYLFFVGLVPYLPDYGGYVRFIVGIVICVFLGIYGINKLKKLIEARRKRKAQSKSAEEIQKNVDHYDKALEQHNCPCCGKDFLIKDWTGSVLSNARSVGLKVSKFCRNCGTQLFEDCKHCEDSKYTFSKHCTSCGKE